MELELPQRWRRDVSIYRPLRPRVPGVFCVPGVFGVSCACNATAAHSSRDASGATGATRAATQWAPDQALEERLESEEMGKEQPLILERRMWRCELRESCRGGKGWPRKVSL